MVLFQFVEQKVEKNPKKGTPVEHEHDDKHTAFMETEDLAPRSVLLFLEFNFNLVSPDFLGIGPTLICIPKSSKDLDKIDTLGSISKDDITKQLAEFASKKTKQKFVPIQYRHKEQFTIALDYEPILKKIR